MNLAYVRVSTKEQHTDRQRAALESYGIDVWYEEKISGKDVNRPELQRMLSEMKAGDTVYISELSRLGRSMIDLRNITTEMTKVGVKLVSLKEPIDLTSNTAYGMFTAGIFQLMAEFERALIKERQAEGIAAAIASGKKWGKQATFMNSTEELDALMEDFYYKRITHKKAVEAFGGTDGAFYSRFKTWMRRNGLNPEDRPQIENEEKRGRKKNTQ